VSHLVLLEVGVPGNDCYYMLMTAALQSDG
jgi:hypothetical protein